MISAIAGFSLLCAISLITCHAAQPFRKMIPNGGPAVTPPLGGAEPRGIPGGCPRGQQSLGGIPGVAPRATESEPWPAFQRPLGCAEPPGNPRAAPRDRA